MGHEVCVGNPRKLRAIWDADDKSDERDARILGMMYRLEPRLLHPIQHRGEQAQADLEMIKARDMLVRTRASLVNHARGTVKAMGQRLPPCSVEAFGSRAPAEIPAIMWEALSHIVETVTALNQRIKEIDKQIGYLCRDRYPETKYLLQVTGVGPITALAFVLTIETPDRFEKSRAVGAYLGLTPRRDQSGEGYCQKFYEKYENAGGGWTTTATTTDNEERASHRPPKGTGKWGRRLRGC
jgi:transposase